MVLAAGEGHKRFDLKPDAVLEYDVSFFHLGKQEHETAQERILQVPTQALLPVSPLPVAYDSSSAARLSTAYGL
jgi:hypothetical protein